MERPVPLAEPIVIGEGDEERRFTTAVLRNLTGGEAIEAQRAAEVALPFRDPVTGKSSAICAISPTLATRERVLRQIARLESADGHVQRGPIPPAFLKHLSEIDYERLVNEAEDLDNLALGAAAEQLGLTGGDAGEPEPRGGDPLSAEMAAAADPRGRPGGDRGGREGDAEPDRRAVSGLDPNGSRVDDAGRDGDDDPRGREADR